MGTSSPGALSVYCSMDMPWARDVHTGEGGDFPHTWETAG